MELQITGKNMEIDPWVRSYIERKLGKLNRHLPNIMEARFEITEEQTKSPQQHYVAQLIVDASGMNLRAEGRGENPLVAVDRVEEVMDRQISDFKGKRHGQKSRTPSATRGMAPAVESGPPRKIAKIKQVVVRRYTVNEAVAQLEALEYHFLLFYNTASGSLNIIYRLEDGNFGLIEPDLACMAQPPKT
jgi:putative sigma-54 modulation protein